MLERPIGIYFREADVGSADQQENELRLWAMSRDCPTIWYRDKSGMTKLIRDIQAWKIGTLLVWRLDRLSRSARGLASFFRLMVETQVSLVSLEEGIDLDLGSPTGQMIVNSLTSIGLYETEIDPSARTGQNARVVTPEIEEVICQLHGEGASISSIASTVGLSRTTVSKLLNAQGLLV